MRVFIIGAGGVGSWLCPSLCKLVGKSSVVVCDGDDFEPGNLDRQLFSLSEVGKNKAIVLADKYGCESIPQWYNLGIVSHSPDDWIFACVDNNPARMSVLAACDRYGCRAIIAANERTSAEAMLYDRRWNGSKRDPRFINPDMVTDKTRDPQAQAIGCMGQAQEETPQLVTANFMAAALAQWLFVAWALELPKMLEEDIGAGNYLPYRLVMNLSRAETYPLQMPTEPFLEDEEEPDNRL